MNQQSKKRAELMRQWKTLCKEHEKLDSKLWNVTKKIQKIETEILKIDNRESEIRF
jgi:hypothetical protein